MRVKVSFACGTPGGYGLVERLVPARLRPRSFYDTYDDDDPECQHERIGRCHEYKARHPDSAQVDEGQQQQQDQTEVERVREECRNGGNDRTGAGGRMVRAASGP